MLVRYDKKELKDICTNLFFDYMENGKDFCIGKSLKKLPNGYSPVDCLHRMHIDKVNQIDNRLNMLCEMVIDSRQFKQSTKVLEEMEQYLMTEKDLILNTNAKVQRKRYSKCKVLDYSRTGVRIPLNKKINPLYDDFILEVLFYDDVTTLAGRYDEYKQATDKRKFLEDNIEITHMAFLYNKEGLFQKEYVFMLKGVPTVQSYKADVLLRTFKTHEIMYGTNKSVPNILDFKNLTLEETMQIVNNDIRQIIQSKLDIDSMNLTEVFSKNVGNDNYKLLKLDYEGTPMYFIRYICPSTGRVYFNLLDFKMIALSEYYNENDYSSWINAWWSIAHVGACPYNKAMIRC